MAGKLLIAPLLLAGLSMPAAGCGVTGDEPIVILRNQVPSTGCTVTANTMFRPRGRIDVEAAGGYLFTPSIQNRAAKTDGPSRIVFIEGANIDLNFASGAPSDNSLKSFKQNFSGSIEPGATSTYAFEIIPKATLDAMTLGLGETTEVVADVEVFGTLDGGDVVSNVFHYPIDVCNGCLTVDLGECSLLPPDTEGSEGGICQTLQDGVLECCTVGAEVLCPAEYVEPIVE